MNRAHNVLGRNVQRVDAVGKVAGIARYTMDVKLPGMLHCKMVRSPYPFAIIKTIDYSKALSLKGVRGIITQLDFAEQGISVMRDVSDDKVRFTGDIVAGIAAETERIADDAVKLVKVEYEPLKPVHNVDEAMDPDAPKIWPGGNGLTLFQGAGPVTGPPHALWSKGDLQKGFDEADEIVDITVNTGSQSHMCFEPHAVVANWDGCLNEMTVWLSTQQIYVDQQNIAQTLGLNAEQVRVICTYCGGAFGGKLETFKDSRVVALLSRKIGRPVKYVQSREEELAATACRLYSRFNWKLGAKKDGKVTAVYLKNLSPCGPHTALNPVIIFARTDYLVPTYFISENCAFEGRGVYTNNMPTSAFRGFGYFESNTALGMAVDILCEKLSIDPYDFHMKNMPVHGTRIGMEQGRITVKGLHEALTACIEEAGWKQKRHAPSARVLPDGRLHGMGMAYGMGRAALPEGFASGGAMIKIGSDGKAKVYAGVSDLGTGQATGCVQIAAEALGMNFEDVSIVWGDTVAPNTNFQAASSTTVMTGSAIKNAADDIREKALNAASEVLGIDPKDLYLENGIFRSGSSPDKKLSYQELVRMPATRNLIGVGSWSVPLGDRYPRAPMFNVIEIAVDPETGSVEILNLVQSTDCGRVISRSRVEGQMHGVLSGGVGFTMLEDIVLDEKRMRILNANMSDYKLFTSMDNIDVMKTIIVEKPDELGPFGARGMGEACYSAASPALANAIYNAIGVRIYETPFTPDTILTALGKVKGGRG